MKVEIIIDGVKHELVKDSHDNTDCEIECSLYDICKDQSGCLCRFFVDPFGTDDFFHFEEVKEKEGE